MTAVIHIKSDGCRTIYGLKEILVNYGNNFDIQRISAEEFGNFGFYPKTFCSFVGESSTITLQAEVIDFVEFKGN